MRDRLTKVESALIKLATHVGEIRREQASMRLEIGGLRNELRTSINGLEASIQEIAVTTRGLTNAVLQLMHRQLQRTLDLVNWWVREPENPKIRAAARREMRRLKAHGVAPP